MISARNRPKSGSGRTAYRILADYIPEKIAIRNAIRVVPFKEGKKAI